MSRKDKPREVLSLTKLISAASYRHHNYEIFADFVEMAAISISNAVDIANQEEREKQYLRIAKKYEPRELERFPEMLDALVNELETGVSDVLGKTYHELELHNKWAGQYFTPFTICQMMAKMTLGDVGQLPECGYLTVGEPAAGSGAMVLAFSLEMKEAGFNYQTQIHVTATDVDLKCVAMAYIQLSLLHIPAVVIHGDSLSLEEWSRWYTPAHILGLWSHKLRRRNQQSGAILEALALETEVQPIPPDVTFDVDDRGQGLLFGDDAA